jgi:hypothetical protein
MPKEEAKIMIETICLEKCHTKEWKEELENKLKRNSGDREIDGQAWLSHDPHRMESY